MPSWASLMQVLAELEAAIARQDINAAKAAHNSFHALLLASARNPLLVAMFNQAQVARLSNVAPQHKGFYDPRHLAHHRALLRALRRRDARAAAAAVRRHYRSLGLMLAVVSRTRRKPGGSRTENEGAPVAADAVAYARPLEDAADRRSLRPCRGQAHGHLAKTCAFWDPD